jgi:hypothetical protein
MGNFCPSIVACYSQKLPEKEMTAYLVKASSYFFVFDRIPKYGVLNVKTYVCIARKLISSLWLKATS